MAERDRAAVHVDLFVRHAHLEHEAHRYRGEGLVDLEQVDVVHRETSLRQRLAGGRHRAGEHDGRVGARQRRGDDAPAWREPHLAALRLAADQHGRGAIDYAGRVAGGVHVADTFHLRVARQRHRIEAHRTQFAERQLQRTQAFQRGARLDELVAFQNRLANGVLHRDDGSVEATFGLRGRGALLRGEGKAVHILTLPSSQRGDQVGTDALRHEAGREIRFGVLRPGAAIRTERHARHAFDASGHDHVLPAASDLLRGEVHRLQTRGAEAVDLHARDPEIPARLQRRRLRDHRALLAHRRDDAHHDVVELRRVEGQALLKLREQAGQQIDRLHLVEAAVLLAFAARRAHSVKDHRVGHGDSPIDKPLWCSSHSDQVTKQVLG